MEGIKTIPNLLIGRCSSLLYIYHCIQEKQQLLCLIYHLILTTCRTGPDSLARRLIDNPHIRTFKLLEKRRIRLEGPELDEHYRQKREQQQQQQRIKEEWVFYIYTHEVAVTRLKKANVKLVVCHIHSLICFHSLTHFCSLRHIYYIPTCSDYFIFYIHTLSYNRNTNAYIILSCYVMFNSLLMMFHGFQSGELKWQWRWGRSWGRETWHHCVAWESWEPEHVPQSEAPPNVPLSWREGEGGVCLNIYCLLMFIFQASGFSYVIPSLVTWLTKKVPQLHAPPTFSLPWRDGVGVWLNMYFDVYWYLYPKLEVPAEIGWLI